MTDLRKAAEMALEALHNIDQSNNDDAIEALRQALAQSEHEPVAWIERDKDYLAVSADPFENAIPVYTTPPKREWVGLTDAERLDIREWQRIQEELGPVWAPMMLYLYEAIEAKLKEKNT